MFTKNDELFQSVLLEKIKQKNIPPEKQEDSQENYLSLNLKDSIFVTKTQNHIIIPLVLILNIIIIQNNCLFNLALC